MDHVKALFATPGNNSLEISEIQRTLAHIYNRLDGIERRLCRIEAKTDLYCPAEIRDTGTRPPTDQELGN